MFSYRSAVELNTFSLLKNFYTQRGMCSHQELVEGTCILCGLCVSFDQNYISSYTFKNSIMPYKIRYKTTGEVGRYDAFIMSLVTVLGAIEYSEEIKHLFSTKKFSHRACITNRVLSVIYYVLKKHKFPILYRDLQPYTEKDVSKVKKIVLREFQYTEISIEYLKNVFYRVQHFCIQRGLKKNSSLVGFLSTAMDYRSTSPQSLCAAYFIGEENTNDQHRKYGLDGLVSMGSLKGAVRKVHKNTALKKGYPRTAPDSAPIIKRMIRANIKNYFVRKVRKRL